VTKMRRILTTLCLISAFSFCKAQSGYKPTYPFEIGLQLGTAIFLGDLGGQVGIGRPFLRDTDLGAFQPTVGVFGRWNIGAYFSARLDLNYLMLKGDDRWAGAGKRDQFTGDQPRIIGMDDSWFRWYRQLDFRSRVFEASIAAEIIPYNFELGGGYQDYSVISPYGFVGLGIFNFKPQGTGPDGGWIDLKPLSTEGQGLVDANNIPLGRPEYKLTQLNVPIGFGVKWIYNDQWALSMEVNHRLTFTDYIDDLSTDYIDPQIFYDNMTPDKADVAAFMARKSILVDPGNVNGIVSSPNEQRGDPKDNDSYYTITIRFSYFIDPNSMGGGRRYGCPVW
jgi:hypothetical protein